jgi:hypothetical protein
MPSCIPGLRSDPVAVTVQLHQLGITQRGGRAMEFHFMFVPSLLAALQFVLRLLPLLSDRVNDRAVRLAKAKNKQSK